MRRKIYFLRALISLSTVVWKAQTSSAVGMIWSEGKINPSRSRSSMLTTNSIPASPCAQSIEIPLALYKIHGVHPTFNKLCTNGL